MKLKKGDTVQIMKGKDKGKKAQIEKVFTKEQKVLLPNLNTAKRHYKARSLSQGSEIVTLTVPVPVANVQLVCPKCGKVTRVGYEIAKNDKIRVCRKCGKAL